MNMPFVPDLQKQPHWQPDPLSWILIIISILLFVAVFIGVARAEVAWDSFTDEQIVSAIFKAEGGYKAQYLFGIRSIKYKDFNDAKQICLNSVRNSRKRWTEAGKPYDLIIHIGLRYCPPKAHPLNSNWVKNVKYFLTTKCK